MAEQDSFTLYGREKTEYFDGTPVITQQKSKVYTNIQEFTDFTVTEADYTEDYVTTIEAVYVDDEGTHTITLDPDRENPLSTGELEVRGDVTITYTNTRKTLKVSVWKTDMEYNSLKGAKFVLYRAEDCSENTGLPVSGAVPIVPETEVGDGTGDTILGILPLGDLPLGEYWLFETESPSGYDSAESAIKISVGTGAGGGVTAIQSGSEADVDVKGNEHWVAGQDDSTWQVRVWNNPGVELPMTGGAGTGIYYVLGALLVAIAGAWMILIRRIRTIRKSRRRIRV